MNTLPVDDLKFVGEVRKKMAGSNIMLSYNGRMSQDIVVALLNLTEKKLTQENADSPAKSKVFSVLVECLQNITQHSDKEETDSAMFMIGQTENAYTIYSGNLVKSEDKVTELRDKIAKLNTMSENELKEFHKYWMKNELIRNRSGFGLGLIQIARKTGNRLEFDFEYVGSDNYFFSLKTTVAR